VKGYVRNGGKVASRLFFELFDLQKSSKRIKEYAMSFKGCFTSSFIEYEMLYYS
jgi:hypothetical protein